MAPEIPGAGRAEGRRVEIQREAADARAYPHVSLLDARARRDDAKRELAAGVDPAVEKKKRAATRRAGAANTFETVAREWFELNKARWSKSHATTVERSLERDLFPELGALPIRDLTEALLLDRLRAVEKRGAVETAKRVRQRASEIVAYAAAPGLRFAKLRHPLTSRPVGRLRTSRR